VSRKQETGVCNRQDQSVFSILTYNLEQQYRRYGYKPIPTDDQNHPNNNKQRHRSERGQKLRGDYDLSCKK
jgi:hypothetical protein